VLDAYDKLRKNSSHKIHLLLKLWFVSSV